MVNVVVLSADMDLVSDTVSLVVNVVLLEGDAVRDEDDDRDADLDLEAVGVCV